MRATQKVNKTILICDNCESFIKEGEQYLTVAYAMAKPSVDFCEICLLRLIRQKLQTESSFREQVEQKREFNRKRLEKCFENNGEIIW